MSLIYDIILPPGIAAARPAAGSQGRLYYSTDTQVLERDTGVAWETYATGLGAHAILSASHSDTDPQAVTRGSIIYGNVTPDWTELVIGAATEVLTVNAGGTEPEWAAAGGGGGRAADDYYGGNLIKNSPGQIPVDGAEPQWWDESSGNATLTDEDTAGEAPPDIHERCFKCVTIANDEYGLQTFTLADEQVLDAGVTIVSFGCWVYCATGAKASIGIFGTNLTLQESVQVGAGAWEWVEVNNITLNAADATIQVRLIVDTDTAWFTMPMFAVGVAAQLWVPRQLRFRLNRDVAYDVTGGDIAWSDLDLTAFTDPLTVLVNVTTFVHEPNGVVGSTFSVAHSDVIRGADETVLSSAVRFLNSFDWFGDALLQCDDGQNIRISKDEVDGDADFQSVIFLVGYYMWE